MSLKISALLSEDVFQDVFHPSHSTKKAHRTPKDKKPPKIKRRSKKPHTILFSQEPLSISFQNSSTNTPSFSKLQKKTDSSYFVEMFEDFQKIGEGSFGEVFRVRSRETGCLYAVKKSKEPFRGECDRLKKLEEVRKHELIPKHKNCVGFITAWEEGDYLYIQQELCKMSLEEYVQSNHHLTNKMLWEILLDLLSAVKHLHDHNLIHLDIKLENILIDENDHYKLGDFGLVVNISEDLKEAEEGDPKYLAPELMTGNFTKAADIFSIGITMLELAANLELPSAGPLWHELRNGIFPEDFTKNICSELLTLIKWMMTPDFVERPTVDQLLQHQFLVDAVAEYNPKTYTNFVYQQILSVCHFGISAIRLFLRKIFTSNGNENHKISGDGVRGTQFESTGGSESSAKKRSQVSRSLLTTTSLLNDSFESEPKPMDWGSGSEGESSMKLSSSRMISPVDRSSTSSEISPIEGDESALFNTSIRGIFVTNSTPYSPHCCTPRKRSSAGLDACVTPVSHETKRFRTQELNSLDRSRKLKCRQSLSPRNLLPVFYGCED